MRKLELIYGVPRRDGPSCGAHCTVCTLRHLDEQCLLWSVGAGIAASAEQYTLTFAIGRYGLMPCRKRFVKVQQELGIVAWVIRFALTTRDASPNPESRQCVAWPKNHCGKYNQYHM